MNINNAEYSEPEVKAMIRAYIEEIDRLNVKLREMQPVKHGRWIWDSSPEFGNPYGSYNCSECESKQAFKENFCPDCGARMDLKDGDTNG